MLTLVPNLMSNLLKRSPGASRQHLMLAGISQTLFLNQWGVPETRIGLKRIGSLDKLGSLFLIADSPEEACYSVWIYKKRDRILFFTKKRLVSHSRWSEFRETWKKTNGRIEVKAPWKSIPLFNTPLSLVA
ncbi:MAG TPA: hypothetical protein VLZ03_16870 [Thermodesulfobacteriota bacterium]|nr:hypothetical protein [Thermodesulfobacteriota bacterium]